MSETREQELERGNTQAIIKVAELLVEIEQLKRQLSAANSEAHAAINLSTKNLKERDEARKELEYISQNLCGCKVEGEVTHDMVYAFVEGEIEKQSDLKSKAEQQRNEALAKLADKTKNETWRSEETNRLKQLLTDAEVECAVVSAECDGLRKQLAKTEAAVDWERREGQRRLSKAESACAEKNTALQRIRFVNPHLDKPIADQMKEAEALCFHALSSDSGKGWHSPAEWEEMEKRCAALLAFVRRFSGAQSLRPGPDWYTKEADRLLTENPCNDYVRRSDAEADTLEKVKPLVGMFEEALAQYNHYDLVIQQILEKGKAHARQHYPELFK